MGAIQNQMNQALGSVGVLAGVAGHNIQAAKANKIAEAKNQAEIAATNEQLEADKLAYKNDTIEASLAIRAHESDFDPVVGGKKMSEYIKADGSPDSEALSAALTGMSEDEVNRLAGEVDAFRSGKLTTDRAERIAEASALPDTGYKVVGGKKITTSGTRQVKGPGGSIIDLSYSQTRKVPGHRVYNKDIKNQQLEKAYEAERELNNRIAASRKLKFDISAAKAKIQRLGGKK